LAWHFTRPDTRADLAHPQLGINLIRAVTGLLRESRPVAIYGALKAMLLSLVVTAYVSAGQEPPVARIQALLDRAEVAGQHG